MMRKSLPGRTNSNNVEMFWNALTYTNYRALLSKIKTSKIHVKKKVQKKSEKMNEKEAEQIIFSEESEEENLDSDEEVILKGL